MNSEDGWNDCRSNGKLMIILPGASAQNPFALEARAGNLARVHAGEPRRARGHCVPVVQWIERGFPKPVNLLSINELQGILMAGNGRNSRETAA